MTREEVIMDAEGFQMQRAYLFALTIRPDVPNEVKEYIEAIERKMAEIASVKSVFAHSPSEPLVNA